MSYTPWPLQGVLTSRSWPLGHQITHIDYWALSSGTCRLEESRSCFCLMTLLVTSEELEILRCIAGATLSGISTNCHDSKKCSAGHSQMFVVLQMMLCCRAGNRHSSKIVTIQQGISWGVSSVGKPCGSHPGVKEWWHTRLQCQGGFGRSQHDQW